MKRLPLITLFIIPLIGLFFRTYKVIDRFNFDQDGDLASWIVKDIVVNYHPRLVGQLTTAPGIFIGPFYYYLIALFITSLLLIIFEARHHFQQTFLTDSMFGYVD